MTSPVLCITESVQLDLLLTTSVQWWKKHSDPLLNLRASL